MGEGWLNKKSFSFFLLGNVIENFTIWNYLETISMIPLVTNNNFIFQRIFLCKILGVDALKKFGSVVSLVNRGLNHHFSKLTKDPSLNTQSCIRHLFGVRVSAFWAVLVVWQGKAAVE